MEKGGFWRKDWFLGLVVAFVLFFAAGSDLIQSLERKAYDLGVRATDRVLSDRIARIAIDDASIANIGRWPWPRDVHARPTALLARGQAKVLGNLSFFAAPQLDLGLAYVNQVLAEYQKAVPNPNEIERGVPLARADRLNHPNIVTIFDAGEEHDLAYIAMEFLKDPGLTPSTKPAKLMPPDAVISIVARVAKALGYAHRQQIVYRDIKPASIMYEAASDAVKVTDFGIARITDSSKTKTGMVLGTPSFMSPEQLAGKRIDGRSDLFSLAVTLYQLLSGRLPLEGESMAQLMYKTANEAAPDIRTVNPNLPPALSTFIARAMAKGVSARLRTGEEFAAALRARVVVPAVGGVHSSTGAAPTTSALPAIGAPPATGDRTVDVSL